MNKVIKRLKETKWYKKTIEKIRSSKSTSIGGLWGGCFELLLSLIIKDLAFVTFYVTQDEEAAENSINNLRLFLDWEILYFPARQQSFDVEAFRDWLGVLHRLAKKIEDKIVIISPIQAILQPLPKIEMIEKTYVFLNVGDEKKIEDLTRQLKDAEFERRIQVEFPGEFSLRGGILDIWSYIDDKPFRIEFFGDTIDTIREFDVETQLSSKGLKKIFIPLARKSDFTRPSIEKNVMLFDYFGANAIIALKEPRAINEAADRFASLSQDKNIFSKKEVFERLKEFQVFNFSSIPFASEDALNLRISSTQRIKGNIWDIVAEIKEVARSNIKIFIFAKHSSEIKRLKEIFKDNKINLQNIKMKKGSLSEGFEVLDPPYIFLSHNEMFHKYELRRSQKTRYQAPMDGFFELEAGDFAVHTSYGIGRFLGMEKIEKNGELQEFLALEYQDGIKVYVPVSKIEHVTRYVGGRAITPNLSKIGGILWHKKVNVVKDATFRFAKELLELEAIRLERLGISHPEDSLWQKEFEASFSYEDTIDQVEINVSIKEDMMRNMPMDRLLCGDVGYGKTELAMRAAFKAATCGYQVAMFVPTTILAEQHYRTFSDRMAEFPIDIKVLSRFKTKKEQKEIIGAVKDGRVDILIGTHRILSGDVIFKNLGLVIIDEEQRFGVEHKEHLKRLRATADVIAMTATPIPRTLHMSLLGIRYISNLTTPPQDRLSIKTEIITFDNKKIREAILKELERGGQVYFVHNRVYNIENIVTRLKRLVPEATFEIAHGQMRENLLNETMLKFIAREIDVLVTTTIIESGLDIPNVNTIFIDDAHMFGLADLHQLRGRVGRYKRRAFAYLIVPEDILFTSTSEKRVRAIEEFSELGAGFKIAMRDLEIRGAGNILGKEQSGHIQAVGYDMYCKLLKLSVKELKSGGKGKLDELFQDRDIIIDLNVKAFIPEDYISATPLKLRIYRKIASSRDLKSLEKLKKELIDRFGKFPQEVRTLLDLKKLKIIARPLGITSIVRGGKVIIINFLDGKKIEKAFRSINCRTRLIDQNTLHLELAPHEYTPSGSFNFIRNSLLNKGQR